jgi:hypothetical protein
VVGGRQPFVDYLGGQFAAIPPIHALYLQRPGEPGGKQRAEHEFVIHLSLARNGKILVAAQTKVILDAHRFHLRRQSSSSLKELPILREPWATKATE